MNLITRPRIDWSKPIRWNTGEPIAGHERVMGHIILEVTPDTIPESLKELMDSKHFKDAMVVTEYYGHPVGYDGDDTWVENTDSHAPQWLTENEWA